MRQLNSIVPRDCLACSGFRLESSTDASHTLEGGLQGTGAKHSRKNLGSERRIRLLAGVTPPPRDHTRGNGSSKTPGGDLAIVLLESADLAKSLFGVATSNDPFDVWFRAHVLAVHGVDLAGGINLPEQVLDYTT